jgi:hypothetical protein
MTVETGKRGRAVSCLEMHKSVLLYSVWDLDPSVPPFMRRQGLAETGVWVAGAITGYGLHPFIPDILLAC